jgi:hypothetical protein
MHYRAQEEPGSARGVVVDRDLRDRRSTDSCLLRGRGLVGLVGLGQDGLRRAHGNRSQDPVVRLFSTRICRARDPARRVGEMTVRSCSRPCIIERCIKRQAENVRSLPRVLRPPGVRADQWVCSEVFARATGSSWVSWSCSSSCSYAPSSSAGSRTVQGAQLLPPRRRVCGERTSLPRSVVAPDHALSSAIAADGGQASVVDWTDPARFAVDQFGPRWMAVARTGRTSLGPGGSRLGKKLFLCPVGEPDGQARSFAAVGAELEAGTSHSGLAHHQASSR